MNENPKNLDDCLKVLDRLVPIEIKNRLKEGKLTTTELHHSLGRYLRNNWSLWGESELKEWFKGIGIFHPDDMSGIILDSFVLSLKGESINLEGQIKFYQDYWAKMKENKSTQVQVTEDGTISIL